MNFSPGDNVEWDSTTSHYTFRGTLEGFYGKDDVMCMCTDQTGRGSRPVSIKRLRRATTTFWYTGKVA